MELRIYLRTYRLPKGENMKTIILITLLLLTSSVFAKDSYLCIGEDTIGFNSQEDWNIIRIQPHKG